MDYKDTTVGGIVQGTFNRNILWTNIHKMKRNEISGPKGQNT